MTGRDMTTIETIDETIRRLESDEEEDEAWTWALTALRMARKEIERLRADAATWKALCEQEHDKRGDAEVLLTHREEDVGDLEREVDLLEAARPIWEAEIERLRADAALVESLLAEVGKVLAYDDHSGFAHGPDTTRLQKVYDALVEQAQIRKQEAAEAP